MKKTYTTPKAQKLEFDYVNVVAASITPSGGCNSGASYTDRATQSQPICTETVVQAYMADVA